MMRRHLSRSSIIWSLATGGLVALALISLLAVPRGPEGPAAADAADLGFDLQGHRGARGLYPENTLPGFRGAARIGVTTWEMDVGLTADGVLVVHHDRALVPERTRGADGVWLADPGAPIKSLTLEDLKRVDVGRLLPGSKAARRWPNQAQLDGVGIPALEEVLALGEALAGGHLRYNVETKVSPLSPEDSPDPLTIADALVARLLAAGVTKRASVQSFDWRSLRRVQETAPAITTVYLTAEQKWLDNLERGQPGASPWTAGLDLDDYDDSVPRLVAAAGGAVWSPYFRDLGPEALEEAQALGLRVVVWTVNDPSDMASLIDLGVDGIITDYPDRLREVMAEKALALPAAVPDGK
jgi:glycerophosphoryl diester phosphodiesterase